MCCCTKVWEQLAQVSCCPPCALQYMDRTYVTQQHKTPVFQLGLDLWREQVRNSK